MASLDIDSLLNSISSTQHSEKKLGYDELKNLLQAKEDHAQIQKLKNPERMEKLLNQIVCDIRSGVR
jgi:hypothetical protein